MVVTGPELVITPHSMQGNGPNISQSKEKLIGPHSAEQLPVKKVGPVGASSATKKTNYEQISKLHNCQSEEPSRVHEAQHY